MKIPNLELLKQVITDRYITILLTVMIFLAMVFCIVAGLTLRPSELQIITHYSAFGTENFYRDKWYYLLSFIGFGLLIVGMNTGIALKLYSEKGRGFAIAFVWISLVVLVMAAVVANSILRLALLS
jgi:hypothetical protein